MGILSNIGNAVGGFIGRNQSGKTVTLAAPQSNAIADMATMAKQKRVLNYKDKALSVIRQDIGNWKMARNLLLAEEPKTWLIQNLYDDVEIDGLLTSQLENRLNAALSNPFTIVDAAGKVDEVQTETFKNSKAISQIFRAILGQKMYGYNLIELQIANKTLKVTTLPRTNVVPSKGLYYEDYGEDKTIAYRTLKEYGTYILEFNSGTAGLLNKAVPHVLFKRFAQSCWSELCELYGIPPRVLKTDTQDTAMLNRAEKMMNEMAAAAWFIIDNQETFEWATSTNTNGDVYANLMAFCNNELSLLVNGAIIGQDTKNGSRSKDESAQEVLNGLVASDLVTATQDFNEIVMPALIALGFATGDVKVRFEKIEDINLLLKAVDIFQKFHTLDLEWIVKTFGVKVTGERSTIAANPDAKPPNKDAKNLSNSDYFFT